MLPNLQLSKRYRYITGTSFGSAIAAAVPMLILGVPGPVVKVAILAAFLFGFIYGMATVNSIYPTRWE